MLGALSPLVSKACALAGVSPDALSDGVVTGNTVMLHILAGRSPSPLGRVPFHADWLAGCEETLLGLPVWLPPCVGAFVGAAFFLLVAFAALTSAISLYEACVASVCDLLGMKRRNATFFMFFVIAFLSVFSALGFGVWGKITPCKMDFLTFFDFVTNAVLMPVVAIVTCVFVGWVIKPRTIEDEILKGEKRFVARGLYNVMVKYVAPVLIGAVLISMIFGYRYSIQGLSVDDTVNSAMEKAGDFVHSATHPEDVKIVHDEEEANPDEDNQ